MTRLDDGAPLFLTWTERLVVGGGMLDVHARSCGLTRSDFRDAALGTIWDAVLALSEPSVPSVAALLLERGQLDDVGGEAYLAQLAAGQAFIYAGKPTMQAHAGIVKDWAERRRRLAELGREAARTMSGRRNGAGWIS